MTRPTPSHRRHSAGARHRSRAAVLLAALALVTVVAAAGCSSDDDAEDTTTTASAEGNETDDAAEGSPASTEDYCDATLALETAPMPDIDPSTATEEEMATAVMEYAESLKPKATAVIETAPDELADHLTVLSGALDDAATSGDFTVFETPEATEASDAVHAYDLEHCDWTTVDVVAKEYSFTGIPETLAPGPTSFELTNEGTEAHEIAVMRKNDGVTETTEELLAMPEEEAGEKVTMIGVGGPVVGGESAYLVADLEPGDYIALCFIPVGTTSMDGAPADGPPHFMSGMVTDFSVS